MAVADYRVIRDGKFKIPSPLGGKKINFSVPRGFNSKGRGVLTWVINLANTDDYKFKIRINGKDIWNGRFNGGNWFAMQEVLSTSIMKTMDSTNNIEFWHLSGDGKVYISDVVLFCQVNV